MRWGSARREEAGAVHGMSTSCDGSRGRWRAPWALICLLVLALALRTVILFTGQRYLRSDEAVVGLMAKHVVTRGETPMFLYGQSYGGGHAIVAYLAAPLFIVCGRTAVGLTAISVSISLAGVALVWLILRRYFDEKVALVGSGLYAFSPPMVSQAFLVNGGTETFFLALAALYFFLRAYLEGRAGWRNGLLTGLFSGLAWYAMDYALLYPAVFVLLWILGRRAEWRWLCAFAAGFAVGCLPLIGYDLTHNFEHLRYMTASYPGAQVGFVEHFARAIWGVFSGNLAAFFSGEIDNFKPSGPGAWLHAGALVLSVILIVYAQRRLLTKAGWRTLGQKPLPPSLIPAAFILVYLVMYASAKFSLAGLHAPPRYLLPLCPFASMAIAWACVKGRSGWGRKVGLAVVALLIVRGAAVSLELGMRPWHEEHEIRTSGGETAKLATFLQSHDVELAFAPYEIQWRLMFESDEAVLVTSRGVSPLSRYAPYDDEALERIEQGERFAFIFRRDFAFAEWAARGRRGGITRGRWEKALRAAHLPAGGTPVGKEFVVFYPLGRGFLRVLGEVLSESERAGTNRSPP